MAVSLKGFKSKYIKEAAEFFLSELLGRQAGLVLVTITRDKNLFTDGDCFMHEHGVYDIALGTMLSREETLKTLAHECVHLMQFHTKMLVPGHLHTKWQKKCFHPPYSLDVPWEVQARASEGELVRRYLN